MRNNSTQNGLRQHQNFFFCSVLSVALFFLLLNFNAAAQGTVTITTAGAGTWTAPAGACSAVVEVWGAGGGGAGCAGTSNNEGGGGSGGAYAKATLTIVPATVYNYSVGAGGAGGGNTGTTNYSGNSGGSTWFNTNGILMAVGGGGAAGVASGSGIAGAGAAAVVTGNVNAFGITNFYGGAGANGSFAPQGTGGGGGSAGTASNGNAAIGVAGGVAVAGGGPGANGTAATVGTTGSTPLSGPGGGGSGARQNGGARTGGAGFAGKLIITWTNSCCTSTASLSSSSGTDAQSVCVNSPIANITYTIAGGATGATVSGLPAGVTGNYSAGTFTISGIPTTGVGSPFAYTVSTTGGSCSVNANGTITVNQVSSSITTQTNVNCNGGNNGTATVSASGGTPAYTYAWAPAGGTGATGTGLTAGTFTCTITDSKGCTKTQTVTITEPSVMALNTSVTSATCGANNGTASVTASGGSPGYTYLWTPSNQTTTTATGLSAGSYTITVTDVKGCVKTAVVSVSNSGGTNISASVVSDVNCNGGNNGSATVTVTGGGTPPYTYLWTPSGQTTTTATGLTAGTYGISVTDLSGCVTSQNVTIVQPTALASSVSTQTNVSCNGGTNGSATVSVSGGTSAYTYSWSPTGGTNATAAGLSAGTFTCTITDSKGCTKTQIVTITQPSAIVLNTSSVVTTCGTSNGTASVTASGGSSGYTYLWVPSNQTTPTATGLSAGTYTITVADANGCLKAATVSVSNSGGANISASVNSHVSCNGGNNGSATVTVTSGGTAPFTYLWSPSGQTTATATGLAAGTYGISVTDLSGCVSSQNVVITEPLAISASTSTSTGSVCNNGKNGIATVTASGGTGALTYSWSPTGGSNASATNLAAGIYTVTITDGNGCTKTATADVTAYALVSAVASPADTMICIDDFTGLDITAENPSPGAGLWSVSVGNTSGITNTTALSTQYNSTVAGTNTIMWTVTNGPCVASATVTLNINADADCSQLQLPTGFSPNGNNHNEAYVIHGIDNYPVNTFTVFNRWGNKVYSKDNYKNLGSDDADWKGQNDSGQPLPAGTYYVILNINNGEITKNTFVDLRK